MATHMMTTVVPAARRADASVRRAGVAKTDRVRARAVARFASPARGAAVVARATGEEQPDGSVMFRFGDDKDTFTPPKPRPAAPKAPNLGGQNSLRACSVQIKD